MKLVAQRVLRPTDGASGINAFCYLHAGRSWTGEPPPDLGPGDLYSELVEIPPPGNRVRSYLDIVTPDDTDTAYVRQVVTSGTRALHEVGQALPWSLRFARLSFEFNIELGLAPHWRQELDLLLGYALQVRR
jgi:hypothetical protein